MNGFYIQIWDLIFKYIYGPLLGLVALQVVLHVIMCLGQACPHQVSPGVGLGVACPIYPLMGIIWALAEIRPNNENGALLLDQHWPPRLTGTLMLAYPQDFLLTNFHHILIQENFPMTSSSLA